MKSPGVSGSPSSTPVRASFPLKPEQFKRCSVFSVSANNIVNDTIESFRHVMLSLDGAIPKHTSGVTCNYRSEFLAECMKSAIDKANLSDLAVAGHLNFEGKGKESDKNNWEYHVALSLKGLSGEGDEKKVVVTDPLTGVHTVEEFLTMNDAKTKVREGANQSEQYRAKLLPQNASQDDIGAIGDYKTKTTADLEAGLYDLPPTKKQVDHDFSLLIAATRSTMWKLYGESNGDADDMLNNVTNVNDLTETLKILVGVRVYEGNDKYSAQDVFKMINESVSQLLPEKAEQLALPLEEEKAASDQEVAAKLDTVLFDPSKMDTSWINNTTNNLPDELSSVGGELDTGINFEIPEVDTSWMVNIASTEMSELVLNRQPSDAEKPSNNEK